MGEFNELKHTTACTALGAPLVPVVVIAVVGQSAAREDTDCEGQRKNPEHSISGKRLGGGDRAAQG